MNIFRSRPWLRWAVPGVAAVLLTGGGAAVTALSATARGGLSPRSAAQLLVDVQNAKLQGLSGTVVQTSNLGLPSLPDVGGGGSSDLSSLVSGSHTLRVWYAGPERMRLALLGSFGESDVIRNGTDLWSWSSTTKSATHQTLKKSAQDPSSLKPDTSGLTPQQLADQALKAISPSTRVTTDGTAVVAGRSAYELVLQPRTADSLVGSVRIAIDGATHIPTRVQLYARNATSPAFEVGFTSFSPHVPDASVFRFNPPPGTKVTQGSPLASLGSPGGRHSASMPSTSGTQAPPTVGPQGEARRIVGSGWTSVLVAKTPDMGPLGGVAGVLPKVSGAWGSGRLLSGSLFSVLLTDDGRVVVGAVPPRLLYDAIARG